MKMKAIIIFRNDVEIVFKIVFSCVLREIDLSIRKSDIAFEHVFRNLF